MYIDRIAEDILHSNLAKKKIIILLGARQVGKTTLIKKALQSEKTAFLNFDIEVDKQRFLRFPNSGPRKSATFFSNRIFWLLTKFSACRMHRGSLRAGMIPVWVANSFC